MRTSSGKSVKLLDERLVVPLVVHHQPRDAEPQRGVGGRAGRESSSRPWWTAAPYSGAMTTILRAALHALDEPVRVGHLVFDQVLAVHDDAAWRCRRSLKSQSEVLQAMHPRMAGRLVAVPGVVRPDAAALRLLRLHAADVHDRAARASCTGDTCRTCRCTPSRPMPPRILMVRVPAPPMSSIISGG